MGMCSTGMNLQHPVCFRGQPVCSLTYGTTLAEDKGRALSPDDTSDQRQDSDQEEGYDGASGEADPNGVSCVGVKGKSI